MGRKDRSEYLLSIHAEASEWRDRIYRIAPCFDVVMRQSEKTGIVRDALADIDQTSLECNVVEELLLMLNSKTRKRII